MPSVIQPEMLAPFVMVSPTVTLTPSGASVPAQASALPLENPFRTAVLVDEIRFMLNGSNTAGGGGVLGNMIRVGLRCGRQLLTAPATPVGVLCKGRDGGAEGTAYPYNQSANASYIWRFDKPMYLPTDGQIEADVMVSGDLGILTGSYAVDIAVAVRAMPEGYPNPKKIVVPYAAKWVTPATATSVQLLATSSPSDLRNIHKQPLVLTRFTGQAWGYDGEVAHTDFTGALRDGKLMLYRHDGELGLRDASPFGATLAVPTRSWTVKNAVLAPNGYFIADIDYTPPDLTKTQFALGMVGYHEIDIEELGVPL